MAILAINGGPKTINHTLGKSWPIFGRFDGITRDSFVEAIQAEGLGAALGHSRPMYTHEVFQQHPDCLPRGHAARYYDYSNVRCENAEHAYANTCWSLTHRLFLGPREDMDLILEVVQKIKDNVDELR